MMSGVECWSVGRLVNTVHKLNAKKTKKDPRKQISPPVSKPVSQPHPQAPCLESPRFCIDTPSTAHLCILPILFISLYSHRAQRAFSISQFTPSTSWTRHFSHKYTGEEGAAEEGEEADDPVDFCSSLGCWERGGGLVV